MSLRCNHGLGRRVERRALIGNLLDDAEEQLIQLRGAQRGSSAEAAERLLKGLGCSIGRLQEAVRETVGAALEAGLLVRLPAERRQGTLPLVDQAAAKRVLRAVWAPAVAMAG